METIALTSRAACALVLNGEFSAAMLAKRLQGYARIYCADGAYRRLEKTALKVVAVLGDGDSLLNSEDLSAPFIYLPNQDMTDFEKALNYLCEQGITACDVYGASGGEQDHFLGNLTVATRLGDKIRLRFFDSWQQYGLLPKRVAVTGLKPQAMFSLLPFPFAKDVYATPAAYPVSGLDLTLLGQVSLRNRALSEHLEIAYDEGYLWLFVEDS